MVKQTADKKNNIKTNYLKGLSLELLIKFPCLILK